jgi:hypothetical protein
MIMPGKYPSWMGIGCRDMSLDVSSVPSGEWQDGALKQKTIPFFPFIIIIISIYGRMGHAVA